MIRDQERIAESLNAFHDGDIIFTKEERITQVWKIECEYLGKMVNKNYYFFWIKIYNCFLLEFTPWFRSKEQGKGTLKMRKIIFKLELEILSVSIKNEKIEISCNQDKLDLNYCGGDLLLVCDGIEIFDQEWNKLEYCELQKLRKDYWNNGK